MLRERYGYPAAGVKRTELNLALKRRLLCEEEGIELREGWRLVGVEERGGNDEVVASFDGGRTASGSILVGCDGLKAASRGLVLGKGGVEVGGGEFTGLTQVNESRFLNAMLPCLFFTLSVFLGQQISTRRI